MEKFECSGCGGTLREEGRFYICENCGTKYMIGRDDSGNPFTYHPIEKKEIQSGQMAEKAGSIQTETITVKEIKLSESIASDVHRESNHLEINEHLQLIARFLTAKEWDSAQSSINQVLLSDRSNAQVQWLRMMCDRRLSNEAELIRALSAFTAADGQTVDTMLSNSTPDFAKYIIGLLFSNDYRTDDAMLFALRAILPYAKNEAVYSQEQYKSAATAAIDSAIGRSYEKSFDYLLSSTLEPHEVDAYLGYLERIAAGCAPTVAQKYYRKFLATDPGNTRIHPLLVQCDIRSGAPAEQCIADFENLLKYSDDPDRQVIAVLNMANAENYTTASVSQFVWKLIGYHSEAPEALKNQILSYAQILLQSALWEQARTFLHLILSFDARCADAYWGLCLVRLQARNEGEIAGKKENLIDCPEFKKALALYESSGEKARADELMRYTQKQKATKKAVKIGMIIGAAVIFIIIASFVWNQLKYNTDIGVRFGENSFSEDWVNEEIPLEIKNKGFVDIAELTGIMRFYTDDGEEITAIQLSLSNLRHGETATFDFTPNPDSAQYLCDYNFASLKITFAVTEIEYNDYTYKNLGKGKEKTIKKSTESNKAAKDEKAKALRSSFDAALKAYDEVDINSPSFQAEITAAVSKLDDIWEDVSASKDLMKELYDKSCSYQENREYEKAYFLFSLLASVDYNDSALLAETCYDLAANKYSTVPDGGTEPQTPSTGSTQPHGVLGVTVQDVSAVIPNYFSGSGNLYMDHQAVMVVSIEAGTDAANQLQKNDVIVSIDGSAAWSAANMSALLADKKSGDSVIIEFYRADRPGELLTANITLS